MSIIEKIERELGEGVRPLAAIERELRAARANIFSVPEDEEEKAIANIEKLKREKMSHPDFIADREALKRAHEERFGRLHWP